MKYSGCFYIYNICKQQPQSDVVACTCNAAALKREFWDSVASKPGRIARPPVAQLKERT